MGSILELLAQDRQKMASAALEEVAVDSILGIVVRVFQKLASGGKALGLAQALPKLACADPEEAAVGNTPETPVQTCQKHTFAEAAVCNPEPLLPKNAVAAEVVERNRNPEPLQQNYAVPAAPPVSDPHPYTADSPANPRRSDSHPAGLLAGRAHVPAADSL